MVGEKTEKTSRDVPAISVKNCTVSFGDNVVIDDISFEVPQGSITAVIGPNGSGKTTLLRAILGLVPLQKGKIHVLGKHLHALRGIIGYVPQRFEYEKGFPITVREFMNLDRHKHCPRSRIEEKIREMGLDPTILNDTLDSLSGGQLQRVLIAQATLNHPTLLFLDEPATGIDIVGEKCFYDLVHELNKRHNTTILLVSHDITVVSAAVDNVICVNRKLMCSGPPATALSEKTLSELFGYHVNLYMHDKHDKHNH